MERWLFRASSARTGGSDRSVGPPALSPLGPRAPPSCEKPALVQKLGPIQADSRDRLHPNWLGRRPMWIGLAVPPAAAQSFSHQRIFLSALGYDQSEDP